MKKSVQRHHGYGVEWFQAISTLVVLAGIYMFSGTFEDASFVTPVPSHISAYSNQSLGYGFQ
jgi:hypothetical protein